MWVNDQSKRKELSFNLLCVFYLLIKIIGKFVIIVIFLVNVSFSPYMQLKKKTLGYSLYFKIMFSAISYMSSTINKTLFLIVYIFWLWKLILFKIIDHYFWINLGFRHFRYFKSCCIWPFCMNVILKFDNFCLFVFTLINYSIFRTDGYFKPANQFDIITITLILLY